MPGARAPGKAAESTERHPGRLPSRSAGRRKSVPGGSGRGVPAADGLRSDSEVVHVGADAARSAPGGAPSRVPHLRPAAARRVTPAPPRRAGLPQEPTLAPRSARSSRADSASRAVAANTLRVELQSATKRSGVPGARLLRRWARAAYTAGLAALPPRRAAVLAAPCAICVRIVDRAEGRRLNRAFRGNDKPTNVLAFPASEAERVDAGVLGDLVVCAPVVAAEAREQGKPLVAHWAHMVVHGTLHLLGYEHERPRPARRMEALEVEILRRLGFHDPYLLVTQDTV